MTKEKQSYTAHTWHVSDLVVNVTGKLEGGFMDWPANIQDKILEAMERHGVSKGRKYEMVRAICDYDVDTKWYVIVTIRAPKTFTIQ